ncbi:hypothetical protein [Asticcacaulis solisilvae]|uniref:hypothetical protein n=1 Tax=Asticcacaulis solisilvae TaxID=1217274 RepID=UPI003FD8660A
MSKALSPENARLYDAIALKAAAEPQFVMCWSQGMSPELLDTLLNAARAEGPVGGTIIPTPTHPGFLVWNPQASYPRHQHGTLDGARLEAERLATAYHNTPFYVLVPAGVAIAPRQPMPVRFIPIEPVTAVDLDDSIPF